MGQLERAPRPGTHSPQFSWDDPFLLEQQLTEDERMIRDTARAYAQQKLLPRAPAYLNEETDREIFREMGELGLIGVTFPDEYGSALHDPGPGLHLGAVVTRRLRAMGTRDKPIAPASPWQNCFVERPIGSIRRECVDVCRRGTERRSRMN